MRTSLLLVGVLVGCGGSAAQVAPATPHLVMGNAHRAIRTDSPVAQREFDIGLDALYAFNFDEAIYHFETGMRSDPTCAMCTWGYAFARGPNINAIDKQWPGARNAAERAAKLAVDPLEKALADALVARYAPAQEEMGPVPPERRDALNAGFADAIGTLAAQHPDDDAIQVLFADASLCATPRGIPNWDLQNQPSSPRVVAAQRAVESVLARKPDHIGAIHFYIHVLDNSPNAVKAAPYADRIGTLAPGAGHLVHMASHIYLQVGRYADAEDANLAALAADQRFLDSVPPGSDYELFTNHPVHFLWYTLLFAGKRADAQHYAQHAGHKAMGPFAGAFSASMAAITDARFGLWDDALALPVDDSTPGSALTTHFARGLALVAKGQLDAAAAEIPSIRAAPGIKPKLPEGMMPPPIPPDQEKRDRAQGEGVAGSAAGQVEAAIAMARGDVATAIAACEAAVAAEDGMPREGEIKLLPIPARQRLGALYLAAGRAADAERVYREDLARFPENGWSLFGLATALDAQHRPEAAATWERFRAAWARSDVQLKSSVL